MAPLTVFSARKAALTPLQASLLKTASAESGTTEECEKQDASGNIHPVASDVSVLPPQNDPVAVNNTHNPLLREPQALEVICMLVHLCSNMCPCIYSAELVD